MSLRTRAVWRVLADPTSDGNAFIDTWHYRAREAFLLARSLEADGYPGVEVNRCVIRQNVKALDLLNRKGFLDDSDVVPPEQWRAKPVAQRKETA